MFSNLALFASIATAVLATPSLYLVGDSTMASHHASEGIQGWGVKIPNYLQGIIVVDKAVSGRSARSYWQEGRWAAVQSSLKSGDHVVIEFGHNDGGSPSTSDRASVFGEGTNTQMVTLANGTVETAYTWPAYVGWMIDGAKPKGATPIVASQTPDNPIRMKTELPFLTPLPEIRGTNYIHSYGKQFVGYAKDIATKKGVPYVDHFAVCIRLYTKLGKSTTESYFPKEHTHTSDAGADQVARAFLCGLKRTRGASILSRYINSAGKNAPEARGVWGVHYHAP